MFISFYMGIKMVRAANKLVIGLCIALCSAALSLAEGIESPLNGLILDLDGKVEEYSFLLAGHLYGSPGNRLSVFPSSSFLANIDRINSIDSKFFISLGDNYRRADDAHIANYRASVAAKLKMPLFNSAGNHDLTDRPLYESNFGDTYYHFVYNTELYVILDSELGAGQITGAQLDFLVDLMHDAVNDPDIKSVFIFSHKLIWCVNKPGYQIVFQHLNARSGYADTDNFRGEIEPVLMELSKHKSVYWVSGDIGCSWSLPIFFQKDQSSDVTYIATGIGDTTRDAILQVNVAESGDETTFIPVSLTGEELNPVEHYGLEYWRNFFAVESSPTWIQKRLRMLKHRYFWTGVFAACVFWGLFTLILKKAVRWR